MKFVIACALAFGAGGAGATVIDFEGQVAGPVNVMVDGDYRFVANVTGAILTSSGTKALFAPNPFMPPFNNQMVMSRQDGRAFSLLGLDVFAADGNGLGVPLTFVGTLASGGQVLFTANLPEFGIGAAIPGTRVAVDFGDRLRDVTAVAWRNGAEFHQVDNLRVEAATAIIPEPATWGMMIGGFGLVGAGLRRRRVAGARAG